MSSVRLDHVTHRFDGRGGILDLSLEVEPGEFVTLLGPSGCGKTTTLRIVAGFIAPESGRVLFDEEDVTGRPPERRDIGMVFQSYALFPHLDVFENVAFGLRTRRVRGEAMVKRVREALRLVGLEGTGARPVQSLSGGQQQRVALARAIVVEPRILLLDEPLSNLDVLLREETRAEIRRVQRELRITTLYVTHDRDEALAMSDQIAVLCGGRLQQLGTPTEVFGSPATAFVAGFVAGANLLRGRAAEAGALSDRVRVILAGGGSIEAVARGTVRSGSELTLALRPGALRIGLGGLNRLAGSVARCEFRGDAARLWVDLESVHARIEAIVPLRPGERIDEGGRIELSVSPGDVLAFPEGGETGA